MDELLAMSLKFRKLLSLTFPIILFGCNQPAELSERSDWIQIETDGQQPSRIHDAHIIQHPNKCMLLVDDSVFPITKSKAKNLDFVQLGHGEYEFRVYLNHGEQGMAKKGLCGSDHQVDVIASSGNVSALYSKGKLAGILGLSASKLAICIDEETILNCVT